MQLVIKKKKNLMLKRVKLQSAICDNLTCLNDTAANNFKTL